MSANWPKLSVDLPHDRDPRRCQACDATQDIGQWRECDGNDNPTLVIVVLCPRCAKRTMEPHPRLYERVDDNEPIPGAMPHLCGLCSWRRGLQCSHPDLKANGGPGLILGLLKPTTAHVQVAKKGGGRTGYWMKIWQPATRCAGQTPSTT